MKVLVIASQKGGVGKTTISGHLAVQAEQQGHGPVVLVDCDPQAGLADWWNSRQAQTPAFAQVDPAKLRTHLRALAKAGTELVIVDTPPAVTGLIETVIAEADLVLIPTRPSPHDLRAVGATVALVEAAKKRMAFVINGAAQRARITGQAAISLSQHGTVAPVTLFQRTDFAASMIDGRTTMETDPTGKSAAEIAALWTYIHTHLYK